MLRPHGIRAGWVGRQLLLLTRMRPRGVEYHSAHSWARIWNTYGVNSETSDCRTNWKGGNSRPSNESTAPAADNYGGQ